eukprot:970735-Rhodomonas_salina.1
MGVKLTGWSGESSTRAKSCQATCSPAPTRDDEHSTRPNAGPCTFELIEQPRSGTCKADRAQQTWHTGVPFLDLVLDAFAAGDKLPEPLRVHVQVVPRRVRCCALHPRLETRLSAAAHLQSACVEWACLASHPLSAPLPRPPHCFPTRSHKTRIMGGRDSLDTFSLKQR